MKKISLLLAFMLLSACSAPADTPSEELNPMEQSSPTEDELRAWTEINEENQRMAVGNGLSFYLPKGEIFTTESVMSGSGLDEITSYEYTTLDPEKFAEHQGKLVNGAYIVEAHHTFTGEDEIFNCEKVLKNVSMEETLFGKVYYGEYPSLPRGKGICKADESSKYLVIVKEEAGQTLVWDLVKKTLFQE